MLRILAEQSNRILQLRHKLYCMIELQSLVWVLSLVSYILGLYYLELVGHSFDPV